MSAPGTFAIALSGMQAATTTLQASAHNVANLATPEFHPQRVLASPRPKGGVDTRVERTSDDGTDLAREFVDQIVASTQYRANAKVVRVTRDTDAALINILA